MPPSLKREGRGTERLIIDTSDGRFPDEGEELQWKMRKPCCLFLWQPLSESSAADQPPWGNRVTRTDQVIKNLPICSPRPPPPPAPSGFPVVRECVSEQSAVAAHLVAYSIFLLPQCVWVLLLHSDWWITYLCAIIGKRQFRPWKLRLYVFAFVEEEV